MSKHTLIGFIGLPALGLAIAIGGGWWFFLGAPQTAATAAAELGEDAVFYRSGPFRVGVGLSPFPPQVGENRLSIAVTTPAGKPVAGASVSAAAVMTMAGMAPMRATAKLVEAAPGFYRGPLALPMAGTWPLSIRIEAPDRGATRLKLALATGRGSLAVIAGGQPIANGDQADETPAAGANKAPAAAITVNTRRRQLIGVETAPVRYRELTRGIRAVGTVDYNETRRWEVSLRFDAWIGKLKVDYVGAHVEAGEVLFTVYGPELVSAQREYLELLGRGGGVAADLAAAARKRLERLGMTGAQIQALARRGEPLEYVPILAPGDGTVIEKQVVEGTAAPAGKTLMRIADLSTVWVEAAIYETNMALVHAGMPATVRLPYVPGKVFHTQVDYVYPTLDTDTRTARLRLVLDNPHGRLKPGMYAEVRIQAPLGRVLAVPEQAVLYTDQAAVVFVDLGGGRLAPRKIRIGRRGEAYFEVLAGLQPGAEVVTSGNFLIAAETRMNTAMEQWQ